MELGTKKSKILMDLHGPYLYHNSKMDIIEQLHTWNLYARTICLSLWRTEPFLKGNHVPPSNFLRSFIHQIMHFSRMFQQINHPAIKGYPHDYGTPHIYAKLDDWMIGLVLFSYEPANFLVTIPNRSWLLQLWTNL